MIKFFRSFPRHIKNAFFSLFRHFAMSLSACSALTVTLILFGVFLMIAGNVSLFATNIEDDVRIHVVLDSNVKKDSDIEKIQKSLEKVKDVKKVEFSDKDAELELMIKERGEDLKMFRGEENPLNHAYFVSVKNANNIDKISEEIKRINGVKAVAYGGDSVTQLIKILNSIQNGGLIFVGLLSSLALFLISNAIKMTIYARNKEISIMRNVGATNWYIKIPFMLEGVFIGILGAILPCVFTFFVYNYLYNAMNGQIITGVFRLQPVYPFTLQVCLLITCFGIIVGLLGSFFSTTKYLKWKR